MTTTDPLNTETHMSDTAPEAQADPVAKTAPNLEDHQTSQQDPTAPLKLVVSIHANSATIGVARPDTDPYFQPFNHTDLNLLLDEVPAVLMAAEAQWSTQPRNPSRDPQTQPQPTRQTRPQDDQPQQASLSLF